MNCKSLACMCISSRVRSVCVRDRETKLTNLYFLFLTNKLIVLFSIMSSLIAMLQIHKIIKNTSLCSTL